jgi:signal transduction histidine kinase
MSIGKHWRMAGTAGLILTYAVVSLSLPTGTPQKIIGDFTPFLLLLAASVIMVRNAVSTRGQTRAFWALMATGCALWVASSAMWFFYEVLLHRDIPEPFVGDVILFIHVVPFMAAVALRPHRPVGQQKLYFSTLNFVLLLVWWLFLYAFVVFPDQYVALNVGVYSRNYDLLYLLEDVALLVALGALAMSTRGAWKRIYWNLFVAFSLYTMSSETINAAISAGQYHTGSLYDVPFMASLCWLVAAAVLAWQLQPHCEVEPGAEQRWMSFAPRLARLAILSLPVMGYWAWFYDTASPRLRFFRLLVTLVAMLVLGLFVFVRQYLLDHELMRLLGESRRALDNLQRLQTQVVQKEKLASLGQLVAGAAHEINAPLDAILENAGVLVGHEGLEATQVSMTKKIGEQARRAQELVSGLLSFARQSPGEKSLVEIGHVVQRALQMKMLHLENHKIRIETNIAPGLPPVWGNANQLIQCCLEIIDNALDALEGMPGATFSVNARQEAGEVVLEFADSGPGLREPQRVFDPFYTTKPIGKGTGLGLSATYGVVQDHQGQISCQNRPEGGAIFTIRFSVARPEMAIKAAAKHEAALIPGR